MQKDNFFYMNRPQMLAMLVSANKEYHVLGRGTGKTSGILAPRSVNNIFKMPRTSGINLGATYSQQLTRTLPSMIGGWQKLGYYRDVHYVIGKRPPSKWGWKEPFEPPVKYDYYISWLNGSGMHIASQDVDGSTIGLNAQWLQGDEAKKLNKEKLDEETRPAMRGYRHLFGNMAEFNSECFTTSMPIKQSEKWVLEERKKMDKETIDLIIKMQLKANELEIKLQESKPSYYNLIRAELNKVKFALNDLRRHSVFYQEASSLENFAILGKDYFDTLRRDLPEIIFDTEILNLRLNSVEGCFYPTFNPDYHCYKPIYNITYLESLNYDFDKIKKVDSRQDADCVTLEPLRIAVDWGGRLNFMSIAQHIGKEYRFINELYVKHPEHIDHLAEKFARYYWYHLNKDLYFEFDHTGHTIKENGLRNWEQFVKKLIEVDPRWKVIVMDKHAPPTHADKYRMCYLAFQENHKLPKLRFNEEKCEYTIISMMNAPIKETPKGYEKDKSSERKYETIDPLNATHASDTVDIHINAIYRSLIDGDNYYVGF